MGILELFFGRDVQKPAAKRAKHVYVCGMPGSGNKIIRDYCSGSLGLTAVIWHGNKTERGPQPDRTDVDIYVVVPTRNPKTRLAASTASEADDVKAWRRRVKDWYGARPDIKRCSISYERLCKDPEGHLVALCKFLGEPYQAPKFVIRRPA